MGEAEQMGAFGVIEPQSAGDRVEHAGRGAGQGAAFADGGRRLTMRIDPAFDTRP